MPAPAEPVKLLAAVLWREDEALGECLRKVEERWGALDYRGLGHPFEITSYYEKEMGKGLTRGLLSFPNLIAPESLVEAKLHALEIEDALRGPCGRRVNLDPGYLDLHKLVLASVKYGPMKVHLGRGIYADLVCRYFEGAFRHLEWTFRDFREGTYDADLLAIRSIYRAQLRTPPG